MQTGDTIIRDQQSATRYDEQARETHWFAPDVVFGLAFEFVKPGDSLLDLGIGSGLSSIPFHRVGVQVFGLDGSDEILQVCAAKRIATELKLHDLRDLPLPYPDSFCNHVVSVAVLNSFRELDALFRDIARIVKAGGKFAFTVEDLQPGQADSYPINRVEVDEQVNPESAVTLFRHSRNYIQDILSRNGFVLLKNLEFVAFRYPAENRNVYFTAYVATKAQSGS